jgi:hypothetical protein
MLKPWESITGSAEPCRDVTYVTLERATHVLKGDCRALAGPSPKAREVETIAEGLRGAGRAIEELEGFALVRDKVEQTIDKFKKLFMPSKSTAGATRSVETETDREVTRLRLAEQTKATEEADSRSPATD